MKKKYSIHDIARELNVSATTISFVLNGRDQKKISEPVKRKILDFVEAIGYKPNLVAQSLRTGKSRIIGMLVEDISDPFFSAIARAVEKKAAKLGYKIFFSSTENNTSHTKQLLAIMQDRQVDGYIIAPAPSTEDIIQHLVDENFPVVLFDRYFPSLCTYNVVVDNFGGAYQAMNHFHENGFRKTAFITLDSEQVQMQERMDGYLKAIDEQGLNKVILKIPFRTPQKVTAEKIQVFLEQNNDLDSILFATNYLAIAGLEALKKMKLKIPDNVAIIGFDDNTHFSLFSPSVTAVAQPEIEIGEKAMEQLMYCIKDNDRKLNYKTIRLPTQLVIRESSVGRVE